MKEKRKQHNKTIIHKREVEVYPKNVIDKLLSYMNGQKYSNPRDENERGFNRGIDRIMDTINDLPIVD